MKKSEIKVGGYYTANISGRIVSNDTLSNNRAYIFIGCDCATL